MSNLEQRLRALPADTLKGIRRGIEKESLRVRPDGKLSTRPHPAALGSALSHPHITTDFSESQLELITGVHAGVEACLEELTQVHQVVYRRIGDEMLWCSSMPCGLPADDAIPLGRYGTSNVGRAKTVYRMGLAHRYGRRMQTISGIHYNFSLPGVSNDGYFSLIRNFRRHSWLLLYLFGASPAVCSSFVAGRTHDLKALKSGTLYRPGATSLRMGPLGYQSDAQASLAVSYNSLESYGASLQDALTRPYPPYEKIGIRGADAYTSCSRFLADEVRTKMGVRRRIEVIANGIDLELFDRSEQIDARAKFGLPKDRPVILFTGRMEKRKGIHLCPEIVETILKKHDVAFAFAGDDLFHFIEKEFMPRLKAQQLKGSVHFLGKLTLNEVGSCLRQSDLYFIPSLWENCPYSCLEAMAAGRAIVASDAGGLPELIRDGENGLIAKSEDAPAFARQIERLLEDPSLRERLGRAARRTVEERYTDTGIAQQSLDYYRQALRLGS